MRSRGEFMNEAPSGLAPTGVVGLDNILAGGFIRNRLYLIEGVPGSGKTTAALLFMRDGASRGEPVLYVTLSETEHELRTAAYSHGWDLQGITIHELMPSEQSLDREQQLSMFHPAEVELNTTTNAVLAAVERVKPLRIVLDSLSEMRLLAATQLGFRRQVLALKQYFSAHGITVLLIDDNTAMEPDQQIHSIRSCHDHARAASPRVRQRTTPSAREQVSRCCLSRRLPRLRYRGSHDPLMR